MLMHSFIQGKNSNFCDARLATQSYNKADTCLFTRDTRTQDTPAPAPSCQRHSNCFSRYHLTLQRNKRNALALLCASIHRKDNGPQRLLKLPCEMKMTRDRGVC